MELNTAQVIKNWLEDYNKGNDASGSVEVVSGILQGSVFCLVLFSIFSNSLKNELNTLLIFVNYVNLGVGINIMESEK